MVGRITLDWPLNPGNIERQCQTEAHTQRERLTLCASIYEWLETVLDILIKHVDKRCIDPPASLYTVETADHYLKLHVELLVEVLDLAVVRCDLDALHSVLHESCGCLRLVFADICLSKEKLSIQIRDVYRVCDHS